LANTQTGDFSPFNTISSTQISPQQFSPNQVNISQIDSAQVQPCQANIDKLFFSSSDTLEKFFSTYTGGEESVDKLNVSSIKTSLKFLPFFLFSSSITPYVHQLARFKSVEKITVPLLKSYRFSRFE
jgi:hypothetical protein